jgi:hypothetical protein
VTFPPYLFGDPMTTRYARLALKTAETCTGSAGLAFGESPFSGNMVTRESINFPIAETCKPSKLCCQTCYAACGPITWSASLLKQMRVYNSCLADSVAFAELVLQHRKADFITWNGAGDLFPEAVVSINHIGRIAPDVPVWVRTRKPEMAGLIEEAPNVWVHFSLDRDSLERRERIEWRTHRHHFSYQYAPDEMGHYPAGVDIVFGHDYKLPMGVSGPETCPLNHMTSIAGACGPCRRCFGGQ